MGDALRIERLTVSYVTESGSLQAVRNANLTIGARESMGLVGESGSGKSTLALAALRYLAPNGRVDGGTVRLGDMDLLSLPQRRLREVWGSRIGLVSQNPLGALNPSLTIGRQLDEMGGRHLKLDRRASRELTLDMLDKVTMPNPRSVVGLYPHQLSGGMLQRCAIAMAMVTRPGLLVLDEPTTALDVTTQAVVLDLIQELKDEFGSAVLYITHDLGVISRICDQVAVMYAGEIFERAAINDLFARPLHPYTLDLLGCIPRFEPGAAKERLVTIPGSVPRLDELPSGCVFAPRCGLAEDACRAARPPLEERGAGHLTACRRWEIVQTEEGRRILLEAARSPVGAVATGPETPTTAGAGPASEALGPGSPAPHFLETRELSKIFRVRGSGRGWGRGKKVALRAVDGVTVWADAQGTLGLVGESGSGKTTLARVVVGLETATGGEVALEGVRLPASASRRGRSVLRRMQMIFQNPDASLNPRHTVGEAVARPLRVLGRLGGQAARERALELLAAVRLPPNYYHRYPNELSGGEKQRVAIARAFASAPDLVVCDEPISSLDVSVQGSLMNLLLDLQAEQGTSYLFISHDLAAVQHLSDRIAVMYLGHLMELGEATKVLSPPYHPYTEALLSAIPVPDPRIHQEPIRLRGGAPTTVDVPSGCRFHPRCPRYLGPVCEEVEPPWRQGEGDHSIYCHIPLEELACAQDSSFCRHGDE
ncbi:MAG TPA: ABC transporter ATP-binding protein [Thermoleophilia bacterium]